MFFPLFQAIYTRCANRPIPWMTINFYRGFIGGKEPMKYRKSLALLFIYGLLCSQKSVTKEEIMNKLDISEIAFWRYLQDIRAFLMEFDPGKELIYQKRDQTYRLVNDACSWEG